MSIAFTVLALLLDEPLPNTIRLIMKIKRATISANQGSALARLFSPTVIKNFAMDGYSKLAMDILKECKLLSLLNPQKHLRDFFDDIFYLLSKNYRNEYIYKNAIANNILLGIHSLNSSFMLTEFRADDCKADCVIINGTSTVYEIKSDYDSMARLERQISAYRKVFDRIYVITSENQRPKVSESVGDSVGLMVLNRRNSIETIQKPKSIKYQVNPGVMFDSLRKTEYTQIIKKYFGSIPDVPNTLFFRSCKDLFCQLKPETAHKAMIEVLRKRGQCKQLQSFITHVPHSLKAVSLSCKLTKKEQISFLDILGKRLDNNLLQTS